MTENMKKYLEMISQDEEFRKEVDKLEEEHVQAQKEKIMEHAASKGITLTEADFAESAELSDDELDAVAGGATCGCVVGGGGTATRPKEGDCACAFYGQGYYAVGTSGLRCICMLGGGGEAVS